MRYAIISDVHSNLDALSSVLSRIDALKIDKTVCLGDVVGYNANPNECIEILKDRSIDCVMGNHDEAAAGLCEPLDFNQHAQEAVYWTRSALTAGNVDYLKALKRLLIVDEKFIAVHGSIDYTDEYIKSSADAERVFERMHQIGLRLCFFGHTHVPRAYVNNDETIERAPEGILTLAPDISYLVNPGSVGQPRDSDPDAAFIVYDTKRAFIEGFRVEYDIDATVDKIVKAGLPERLATRLKLGW